MPGRTLAALCLFLAATTPATAQQTFPATLAGHAVVPAQTFVDAPADAPADLKVSGKFTTGRRIEAIGTVEGTSNDGPTGVKVPFRGQPLQGHSGIKSNRDGTFWVLTDNGFGAKANSPDSMLYLNRHRIDWNAGTAERLEMIFLHDPDRKVPFRIADEATDKRYLTGADFDIESFQPIGEKIWIADEFGPYLLRVDRAGKVEAVFETQVEGKPARSPDHYAVASPATPTATGAFNVRRSRGYEGMAASPTGASFTRFSKARSGMRTGRIGRSSTARSTCASWNSTSPARSGRAGTGNTCWRRTARRSATST
jgi:hypothetical protein